MALLPWCRTVSRVAIVLGVAGAFSCHRGPAARESASAPTRRRADRSLVLSEAGASYLRIEQARAVTNVRASFAGRVAFDERHVARLGPAVAGRVAKVDVVTGDRVKAGDLMLVVHATDIATAQAQLQEAKSARLLAERNASRATTLRTEGAGTEAELQQAQAALEQAKSEEQRAAAALVAIGGARGPAEYVLRSPIDGTVIERNVAVGSQVSTDADKPLLTIGDIGTVWVLAQVFEQDLAFTTVGAEASIQVLAMRDRPFTGKITDVTKVIDPGTRAAQARIEVPNPDGALKPGMFARVYVQGAPGPSVEVPSSAVLARRDQFFVFVRAPDGAFVQREVHVANQHGEHTIVASGIAVGEDVVTEGAILLDAEMNEGM